MASKNLFWQIIFLTLPLLVFTFFVIWPLFNSFYYGFTNWNGFNPNYKYVGFDNFAKLYTDRNFRNAMVNTTIWMVAALILPTILGLMLALLIDTGVRGSRVFKVIFYLPICLSAIVVGQIWIWIYQPDWGLFNSFLAIFSEQKQKIAWLARPETALYSVIIAWSWQQTGLAMVIYLAGLTAVPTDLLEVCAIEGTNFWQRTRKVVIPLLTPSTVVVIALSMINSLKGFDILYIMTAGGPFNSSDTLAMHMYNESFKKFYMGYGSAISIVLFLIALTIIGIYFRQLKKLDEIYG